MLAFVQDLSFACWSFCGAKSAKVIRSVAERVLVFVILFSGNIIFLAYRCCPSCFSIKPSKNAIGSNCNSKVWQCETTVFAIARNARSKENWY